MARRAASTVAQAIRWRAIANRRLYAPDLLPDELVGVSPAGLTGICGQGVNENE
jgi:hypothetical protein